jgi:ribose 5-phosphate isomerase B
MLIAIGCDHRGIALKTLVINYLKETGHTVQDFGAYNTTSVDYPDIAFPLAEAVARGECERGILICNTGIGMSMVANKVKGVRAALCHNVFYAQRARQHNDANVLCFGTLQSEEETKDIVAAFLTTVFEGGRHAKRLEKITEYEK